MLYFICLILQDLMYHRVLIHYYCTTFVISNIHTRLIRMKFIMYQMHILFGGESSQISGGELTEVVS